MSTPNIDAYTEIDSHAGSNGTIPRDEHLNKAFYEYVPVNHGYRFGLGSMQFHHGEASKSVFARYELSLETEFEEMKVIVSSYDKKFTNLDGKVDLLQASLNELISGTTPEPTGRNVDLSTDDYNIST